MLGIPLALGGSPRLGIVGGELLLNGSMQYQEDMRSHMGNLQPPRLEFQVGASLPHLTAAACFPTSLNVPAGGRPFFPVLAPHSSLVSYSLQSTVSLL